MWGFWRFCLFPTESPTDSKTTEARPVELPVNVNVNVELPERTRTHDRWKANLKPDQLSYPSTSMLEPSIVFLFLSIISYRALDSYLS